MVLSKTMMKKDFERNTIRQKFKHIELIYYKLHSKYCDKILRHVIINHFSIIPPAAGKRVLWTHVRTIHKKLKKN